MDCIDYDDYFDDDEYDDDDFYDDYQDRLEEELFERACNCTCGAWQHINGVTYHVADCCCGAE